MHLKNGTSLRAGNYIIDSSLGQGGFGITYLAQNVKLGKQVAIKEFFIKEMVHRSAQSGVVAINQGVDARQFNAFKRKFNKEAKKLEIMDHESIVRILDVFEENDTVYYVMDYIDGGSLERKVSLGGPLSEELAVNYIIQVAEALNYMHERHYLHLDVKPSNIMLSGDKAILVDFGASKHYDDDGGQTSNGPIGFSRGYAPAEQYSNNLEIFSPTTDVYALGATLYRILVGQTPPEASLLLSHPDVLTFPDCISQRLVDAIRKAMSPAPADRFQSVMDFVAAVDIHKTAGPYQTDRPDPTELPDRTEFPDNKRPEDKKKKRTWILWLLLMLILAVAGYMIFRPQDGSNAVNRGQQSGLKDTITAVLSQPGDSLSGSDTSSAPAVQTPPTVHTPPTLSVKKPSSATPPSEVVPTSLKKDDGKTWVYVDYDIDLSLLDGVPESITASHIKKFKRDFSARLTSSDEKICIADNASKAEKKVKVHISVTKYTEPHPQYYVWVDMTCSVGGRSFGFENPTYAKNGVKGVATATQTDGDKKEKILGQALGASLTKTIEAIPSKFIEEVNK